MSKPYYRGEVGITAALIAHHRHPISAMIPHIDLVSKHRKINPSGAAAGTGELLRDNY